ncbi:hypothetical protein BH09PSE5_BH09PSE5_10710 [soil metagenome]
MAAMRSRRTCLGFSLVEVMVAMAIGLFLVAGAFGLFANHLDVNRRLLLGARVQQDLQTVTELVARDLRRTGYVDPKSPTTTSWRLSSGAIQSRFNAANWESLTDAETMTVTKFAVTPDNVRVELGSLCTPACVASDGSCPAVTTRVFNVVVEVRATADPTLTRQLQQSIRGRNDIVTGACA